MCTRKLVLKPRCNHHEFVSFLGTYRHRFRLLRPSPPRLWGDRDAYDVFAFERPIVSVGSGRYNGEHSLSIAPDRNLAVPLKHAALQCSGNPLAVKASERSRIAQLLQRQKVDT
jgi:hypothetical protein